jgi:uncharacterized membrane protein
MNKVNWNSVAAFGIVALFVFLVGVTLLGGRSYSGWGMMGPGMMGGWGFAPFGWIGMLFIWLISIGFLVLVVLGIAWLVRELGSRDNPPVPGQTCPSCERGVQAGWRNCPHCGATLTSL